MPSPRYADHRYAGALRGSPPTGYDTTDAPWAFGSVRVDGVTTDAQLSPIVPGREVTYTCAFIPGGGDDDHAQRLSTLAETLVYAADVLTYDVPYQDNREFYREQYDGPSNLLRIAPLQRDHDATWVDGNPPPGRDSIHEPRWAVVVGGETARPLPEKASQLTLQTVTVGATADYPTRDAMVAAARRNGF